MAVEDEAIVVYHCLDNPRILHAAGRNDSPEVVLDGEQVIDGAGRLEFELECGEVLEMILLSASPDAMVSMDELWIAAPDIGVASLVSRLYHIGLINVEG